MTPKLKIAIIGIAVLSAVLINEPPMSSQSQTKLLVISDSLGGGLYASAENKAYRLLLGDWLDKEVGNLRGCTLAGAEQEWPDWEDWGADIILVELGVNDVSGNPSCSQINEEDWPARYAAFIDDLAATGARVIVATIPWCNWAESHPAYAKAIRYNGYIRAAATDDGVAELWDATVDCDACISQPGEPSVFPPGYEGDNFHPGDYGHNIIATTFLSPIMPPQVFVPMVAR